MGEPGAHREHFTGMAESFVAASGGLIEVGACDVVLSNVSHIDHLDGAISLTIVAKQMFGPAGRAQVDQFWLSVLRGLQDACASGAHSSYLADQPVEVAFSRERRGRLRFTLGPTSVSCPAGRLIGFLARAARDCLQELSRVAPRKASAYRVAIAQAEQLLADHAD